MDTDATEIKVDARPSRLTDRQIEVLRKPLNRTRIAHRQQGGKQLSYLESWDVRAHLIRVFGYTGFDVIVEDCQHILTREYMSNPREGQEPKPMLEVVWQARVRLNIRDQYGDHLATYVEAAVGSESGPQNMPGDLHDNAVKTAASDALKRCAINLGTQFGLSLYDNGNTADVVRGTVFDPPAPTPPTDEEALANIQRSLGGEIISDEIRDEVKADMDQAGMPPVAP